MCSQSSWYHDVVLAGIALTRSVYASVAMVGKTESLLLNCVTDRWDFAVQLTVG